MQNKIYRSISHTGGYLAQAQYEIKDQLIYRSTTHAQGWLSQPQYEIKNGLVYRTIHHTPYTIHHTPYSGPSSTATIRNSR